jgi:parallel beta-helix repeat protein
MVLENLTVSANGHHGIAIANGCTVSHCYVENNQNVGILVDGDGSQIIGNTLVGNNKGNNAGSAAIALLGSNNRIEGNHVTGSGTAGDGIQFNNGGAINNVIIKNSVAGNGANNYTTAGGGGNDYGPVGTAATSTSPWANISH